MGGEEILFFIFEFFGYEKMESMKNKPKKEIFFIFFTLGLVILRTLLSFLGLKSGNVVAMRFSLVLNIIPVLQAVCVLLRKDAELNRKRANNFNGIFNATNARKKANPFSRRAFVLLLVILITCISPILYLCRYSTDVNIECYSLEQVTLIYMIFATLDGIIEQLIVLFSVDV